jgi:streptogramin lyase
LVAIAYVAITSNVPVELGGTPSLTFTATSAFRTVPFGSPTYLAEFDASTVSAGWSVIAGPVPLSNALPTVFASTATRVELQPGTSILLALFSTTSAVPSPVPSPTPSPTPPVSGQPIITHFGAGVLSCAYYLAAGSDGNVWFFDASNGAVRITPSGNAATFSTLGGFGPMTSGPDGAMWFTSSQNVGRVALNGSVTYFQVAGNPDTDLSNQPAWITSGQDGNLWFTTQGGSVNRLTPAGSLTKILPNGGSTPVVTTIAFGPDGNLWFLDGNHKMVRLTPAGGVTEFSGALSGVPWAFVGGSDGNVWFTEVGANVVGRITPQGIITEFPVAAGTTVDAQLKGITRGRDGNVWFTERGLDRIGRITPAGVVTEFPNAGTLSGCDIYASIVSGGDGNIWFSDNKGGISRLQY